MERKTGVRRKKKEKGVAVKEYQGRPKENFLSSKLHSGSGRSEIGKGGRHTHAHTPSSISLFLCACVQQPQVASSAVAFFFCFFLFTAVPDSVRELKTFLKPTLLVAVQRRCAFVRETGRFRVLIVSASNPIIPRFYDTGSSNHVKRNCCASP